MKKDFEITMKSIADAIDLSIAIITWSLYNYLHINVETKIQDKELGGKLGYKYKVVAASLRKIISNTIGLNVQRISICYPAIEITVIQSVLHDLKYNLMIYLSNQTPKLELEYSLYGSRVDGFIDLNTLNV